MNDEWQAFGQMAWLDMRTTSGSWRIVNDFPNLPAWTSRPSVARTTHWAGATPRFNDHELQDPHRITAQHRRREPAGLADRRRRDAAVLRPWPRTKIGVHPRPTAARLCRRTTTTSCSPTAPRSSATHFYATGPYGTNAEPYDGRPASIQDGFNFQGDKNGSKWRTLVTEIPKALATGKLDLRPDSHAVQITHDAAGRADAVLYLDADGNLQRQRARVVCVAGNSIETPRLLLLSAGPQFPDGLANSSGQVGPQLHAAHHGFGVRAASSGRCTCTAARRWPA